MPSFVLTKMPINWVTLYSLIDTLPGSDCYSLGSKLGLFLKTITRVSIAAEDEALIPEEVITNKIVMDNDFITRLLRRL